MDPHVKVKLFTSSLALPIQEGSGNQTMHTALQARDSLLHAHSKTLGLLHDCLSCNQCDRYPRSATKEFFEGPLRSFFFIVNQYLISEDLFGWPFYHNYATKELLQGGRGTDRFKRRSFSTTLQIEVMTHHISRILSVFSQK